MKRQSRVGFVIGLLMLIFAQIACQYSVSPTLQSIQQPIFDILNGFANFARSIGLISGYYPAPVILEVTYPDPNVMRPTIKGRVNTKVSSLSILRLYTLKLTSCDHFFAKYGLVEQYPVMDILISPDQYEWVIENAPLNEGDIFGVTLADLSYDKSVAIETGMSNVRINQSQIIELSEDSVEAIAQSGVVAISGGGALENLCLTLERNGLVEGQTTANRDGQWVFEDVRIEAGQNKFVVNARHDYFENIKKAEFKIDGFEIKMEWPFGSLNNGVYVPAYRQGQLTSWYGWNHYHVKTKGSFHNGLDISNTSLKHDDGTLARITDTQVRAVADGVIYLVNRYPDCEGNSVGIDHGGWGTFYIHLDKFASGIKPGIGVKTGDPIGVMGDDGECSKGVHLHMAAFLWKNGSLKNTKCKQFFCGEPIEYININPFGEGVPLNKYGVPYDLKSCTPSFDVWRFNWRIAGVFIDPDYYNLSVMPMHPTKENDPCFK